VADLEALLPIEPGRTDALDWFIGSCLSDGGLWDSPRTSDGIIVERVLERTSNVLRVCGRIWNIEQTLHTFWLEIARDGEQDRFGWFLYFDVAESSARRARNAIDNHAVPDDIEWHARLAGEATVQGDALAIVPGSTRVLVRDMPEPSGARPER
jgi:hypothetical protein